MGKKTSNHLADRGPWFAQHPGVAVAVAVALYAVVIVLRIGLSDNPAPVSELFSLPIALVAFAFGRRAGTIAGAAAVAFIVGWSWAFDVTLSPLGWASRATPLLLLGLLLGAASDRLRDARGREREMAAIAALQREAAEVNDSIVQGLAVAKWLLEANDVERGLAAVTETMCTAQHLVSEMLGTGSPLPGNLRRSRRPVAVAPVAPVAARANGGRPQ